MHKSLHKVFKTVVEENSQDLLLGESGSEVSYCIPRPRNFSEVTKFSYDIKNPEIKATQEDIKKLTIRLFWLNNQRKVNL